MFSVSLRRPLAAEHSLPFLDGSEKERHVHRYQVEAMVMGDHLDDCGFLVNVDLVAGSLEKALKRFEGALLNDMPEFRDVPPTMENLAKAIWMELDADTDRSCIDRKRITIWEAEDTCASFEK